MSDNDHTLSLKGLRESMGVTQTELAKRLTLPQPNLSRIEKDGNPTLAVMRKYVDGLGGELELYAEIGGKRIRLAI